MPISNARASLTSNKTCESTGKEDMNTDPKHPDGHRDAAFDDVYFDFNNDDLWPTRKRLSPKGHTTGRQSISRSTDASSTFSINGRQESSRRRKKGRRRAPTRKKRRARPSSAPNSLLSPAPIPGPFSFYTTNEIFVEDVYPHVKLDMSYLNRPILKRASTAPMELVKGAHNKKLARNKTMLFNAKYQRPSSSNLPSQQDGQRTSNSRSVLDPVPKSPSNIKDGLKKIMFDKRKANVMSQSKSEVAILETTRKKEDIERMLRETALLQPAIDFKRRKPALPLSYNTTFVPEVRVNQLRNAIKNRDKYKTKLRKKISRSTRTIKKMKQRNARFQKTGLQHVHDEYRKEHEVGKKLIQENKLLLSHKNKLKSEFTDSEIEGDNHDEPVGSNTGTELQGLKYSDTDAESIFKNLPSGINELLEQQEKLMKQLLRSKSNRIRYQPKALPTRPLSRSRKMRLKGQTVRRNLENQIYRSAEEEQIDRCHPQKNRKTWAMLSFDKNINVKTDERVLGPYRK